GQSAARSKALTLLTCMEEQDGSALDNEVRDNSIAIYPNPNNGQFTVRVAQAGVYEIITSLGQVQQSVSMMSGSETFEVSGLAAGIYFVRELSNPANLQRVIVVE
ncbi:MAG: T9SS type A sorting domain-containing protein, partial [Flavobacteriales bacterium]